MNVTLRIMTEIGEGFDVKYVGMDGDAPQFDFVDSKGEGGIVTWNIGEMVENHDDQIDETQSEAFTALLVAFANFQRQLQGA